MFIAPSDFEIWAALIRSDQLPQQNVPAILESNPAFARWYSEEYLRQRQEVSYETSPS